MLESPHKHWGFRSFKSRFLRFDPIFDHNCGNYFSNNFISFITYRGVAQLVARDIWDVDAAGSNPVTPTTILTESRGFASTFGQFLCVFKYYDATFGKSIFLRPLIKCGLRKILFFDYCGSNFDIIKRDATEVTPHNNDIHF